MDLGRRQRPTVRDVAQAAGVSVATVSNVLTGRNKYSPQTKERVEAAIRELGFYPEAAARQLKRRRTHTLGVLFPMLEGPGRLGDNPFYWELISAVEAEARRLGYRVLIAQTTPDDSLAFVVERNLDGLVMLGAYDDYPVLARARELAIPTVLVDSYVTGEALLVRINDYHGGYLATRHLLQLGHRRIALVTGTRKAQGVHYERYRGYRDALREAGLPERPEWVLEGPVSFEGGNQVGARLLSGDELPTAVFASADNLALGVLLAARERGLDVPRRLSVVGFDDIPIARFAMPALTTVRQDTRSKGIEAVRLLVRDAESAPLTAETVEVGVQLIVRESTGAPLAADPAEEEV